MTGYKLGTHILALLLLTFALEDMHMYLSSPQNCAHIFGAKLRAHCTVAIAPTAERLPGTSIIDANRNNFAGFAFTEPLPDQMSADVIFQGCFDECKPLWSPESFPLGDKFSIGEPNDFAYFAQSSTHSIPHQTADPYVE